MSSSDSTTGGLPDADGGPAAAGRILSDKDFQRLAELRYGLRSFLHWSAEQAKSAGLTPTQHQLLLTIRGSTRERGPTVGDIADALLIRHHSAVELVDRAQEAGLIVRGRDRDRDHHSTVRVHLTSEGTAKLASLSEQHLRELAQLAPTMSALWAAIDETERAAAAAPAR